MVRLPFLALCALWTWSLLGVPRMLFAKDFSSLISLAEGAILGENVAEAVPGFDIRILKEGQPIFHQAFGNWAIDKAARADSSTKTLSGALMVSLAETGKGGFSLDSRLSDFLPEYDKEGYRDITIQQSFSHTSGLPSEGGTSPILARTDITLRQAAWLISFRPLENGPPGSTFGYGGISMHAAGAAAEVATGESFVDLMEGRITGPLEMTNTRFVTASEANPRVAGGMESTASEFSRFMDMLLNGGVDRATGTRVLAEDSVEEMFTRVTDDSMPIDSSPVDNNRYGIGVWLDQLDQAGPPVDVLAAGARGFHSWIDQSHGLVFTLATDVTRISNIEELSSQMHLAILEAVADPGDFNLDGSVDGADLSLWESEYGGRRYGNEFLAWQRGAEAGVSVLSVPEPGGWLLMGLLMSLGGRNHRVPTSPAQ